MIKLRGFGGKSEFWDHNLESFTLMAGLAAVTKRIQLYASVAVLTIPPAIVARMASTIDSISGGRFGVNIVSGWAKMEYEQMGLWPGEAHFAKRYDYSTEYVTILRELWEKGSSDFKGQYFQMEDCKLSPRPQADMKIVCAGQSPRGMEFGADLRQLQLHRWARASTRRRRTQPPTRRWPRPPPRPAATSATMCC